MMLNLIIIIILIFFFFKVFVKSKLAFFAFVETKINIFSLILEASEDSNLITTDPFRIKIYQTSHLDLRLTIKLIGKLQKPW
jgi:hypothetical protein